MKALWMNAVLVLNGMLDFNVANDFEGSPVKDNYKGVTEGAPDDKLIPALYKVNTDMYLMYSILRAAPAFTSEPGVAMVALASYLFQIVSNALMIAKGQVQPDAVGPGVAICLLCGGLLTWQSLQEGLNPGFYGLMIRGGMVGWPIWFGLMLILRQVVDAILFVRSTTFSFLYQQTLEAGAEENVANCVYGVSGELQFLHALVRGAAFWATSRGTAILAIISFVVEVSTLVFIHKGRHSSLQMVTPMLILAAIYPSMLAWQGSNMWEGFTHLVWGVGFAAWTFYLLKTIMK